MFPKLHVNCLAHGLHRLADFNRMELELKFLSKSGRRKRDFKNITGLHLPPEVVNTRCGTWLQGVFCENFTKICENIDQLEEDHQSV